ncbi:unnamed protein product [Musa textilis]
MYLLNILVLKILFLLLFYGCSDLILCSCTYYNSPCIKLVNSPVPHHFVLLIFSVGRACIAYREIDHHSISIITFMSGFTNGLLDFMYVLCCYWKLALPMFKF